MPLLLNLKSMIKVLCFTILFQVFIGISVYSQKIDGKKYVPIEFIDTILENVFYDDLIIYRLNDWPEYDYSYVRYSVVWDDESQDSIFKSFGEPIKKDKGIHLTHIETRKYDGESWIGTATYGLKYNSFSLKTYDRKNNIRISFNTGDQFILTVDQKINQSDNNWKEVSTAVQKRCLPYKESLFQKTLTIDSIVKLKKIEAYLSDTIDWSLMKMSITEYEILKDDTVSIYFSDYKGENLMKKIRLERYKSKKITQEAYYKDVSFHPAVVEGEVLNYFFQTIKKKNRIVKIDGSNFFSRWDITERTYELNNEGQIIKQNSKHFQCQEVWNEKGLIIYEIPDSIKITGPVYFSYDQNGRLIRIEYEQEYTDKFKSIEIYHYKDDFYIDPKSLIFHW